MNTSFDPLPADASYDRIFTAPSHVDHALDDQRGDAANPLSYVFAPRIELAVNVALAAGRPLLVRGAPGSGKSSLARAVAAAMSADIIEYVVTSSTRARDLLWTFDAVRRLHDAQAGTPVDNPKEYLRPGPLWIAVDPASASRYSQDVLPNPAERAVLLLDEIDKADPDVPNDLLVPLGLLTFTVTDAADLVVDLQRRHPPLVIITTNEERDLPPAFVRRCVVLHLEPPGIDRMIDIGTRHFGPQDRVLYQALAKMILEGDSDAKQRRRPGTAEFLDAIRACRTLNIRPNTAGWRQVQEFALFKWRGDPAGAAW